MTEEVHVCDDFVYHDTDSLASLVGGEEITRVEAEESGRVPCSHCFPRAYESQKYSIERKGVVYHTHHGGEKRGNQRQRQ